MKKIAMFSLLSLTVAFMTSGRVQGQYEDRLGLPGDNLNLYAVMKIFQESETLEAFERNLNDENLIINNLDLDGDNRVDYIRVLDYPDGNDHTIVLQVALSAYENQDVAVFTVDRDPAGNVTVQLVGDEELYGRNYIIEPYYSDAGETANPAYVGNGNHKDVVVTRVSTVEVASWPLVRFVFMPSYTVWRSPWYYGYYPHYWHPWHPHYWDYYYGYHYNYYNHYYGYYHRWDRHRYNNYNDFYYNNHRAHSTLVLNRIQNNSYKHTYSHPESREEGNKMYQRRTASVNNQSKGNSSRESNYSSSSSQNNKGRTSTSAGTRRSSVSTRQNNTVVSNNNRSNATSGNKNSNSNARSSATNGSGNQNRSSSTVRNSNQGGSTIKQGSDNSNRSSVSSRSNSSGRSSSSAKPASSGRSSSSARSSSSSRKSESVQSSGSKQSSRQSSVSGSSKSSRSSGSKQSGKSGTTSRRGSKSKDK